MSLLKKTYVSRVQAAAIITHLSLPFGKEKKTCYRYEEIDGNYYFYDENNLPFAELILNDPISYEATTRGRKENRYVFNYSWKHSHILFLTRNGNAYVLTFVNYKNTRPRITPLLDKDFWDLDHGKYKF